MPRVPALSDDEDESRSAASSENETIQEEEEVLVKKSKDRSEKQKAPTPLIDDEEDEVAEGEEEEVDEDEDMEGGEDDDDVYLVEAIINHVFDEQGILKFHVRWKDYPKLDDHTWEPEENLGTASEALNEYIESVGGRDALAKVPRPKKRGRASTNGTPSGSSKTSKKARKEGVDVKAEETQTPERTKPALPPGNWEDLIASIDTMQLHISGYWVLLTFKDGMHVRQPASTVYKRCPQKMLKFYESNLSITPATRAEYEKTNVEL